MIERDSAERVRGVGEQVFSLRSDQTHWCPDMHQINSRDDLCERIEASLRQSRTRHKAQFPAKVLHQLPQMKFIVWAGDRIGIDLKS